MIQYYKDKGYDAKYHESLIVNVQDLPNNSHIKLEVLCDMCEINTMFVKYCDYNKCIKNTGSYVCKDCSYKKSKQTNLLRYNVDNYGKTEECHRKMKDTLKAKYNVEHNSQLSDYAKKYNKTCINRYGESYSQYFAKKASDTFFKNTGYSNPSQSPEIREKMIQTFVEHYGVDNPLKSPEIREKISQTFYLNSSQKVSKQQCYINNLYQGVLNFPVKHYNVDVYLPNDNIIIEYDGGGHLLNVVTGRETLEEYMRKEIIRNNIIKREGYKQLKIVSLDDLLPFDQILLQMLNEAKQYFSEYPNHSWIEYDIDKSIVRNAEHKDGISYDYGKLRKIKDTDIIKKVSNC